MATNLSLAPAAGSGIGKLLAEKLLSRPDFVEHMVDAVMNGLTATRSFWVKGADGKSELVTEADSKVQLQAFALVLAHMEGEPIKRIIHEHIDAKVDPLAVLHDSPSTVEAMERLLAKAKWRDSGRNTKKAEPAVLDVG